MYCTNCGKNNEQSSNFCVHCGSKLVEAEKKEEKILPADLNIKSNKNWPMIIIGTIFGFAFCLIAAAYAYDHFYSLPKYGQDKLEIEAQKTQANINTQIQTNSIKTNNQALLQTCLQNAENDYNISWKNLCLESYNSTKQHFDDCVKDYNEHFDLEYSQEKCETWWKVEPYDSNCKLNSTIALRLDASLKEAKDTCFKLYPTK